MGSIEETISNLEMKIDELEKAHSGSSLKSLDTLWASFSGDNIFLRASDQESDDDEKSNKLSVDVKKI